MGAGSNGRDVWQDEDGHDVVCLRPWREDWPADDRHANFKSEVVAYGLLDPLATVRGMSRNLDIPIGAIARYVLAKWATGGSGGLLELGPVMVHRLWQPIADAEAADSDEQRLRAYDQLRQMISWLKVPLDDPTVYPAQDAVPEVQPENSALEPTTGAESRPSRDEG